MFLYCNQPNYRPIVVTTVINFYLFIIFVHLGGQRTDYNRCDDATHSGRRVSNAEYDARKPTKIIIT